MSLEDHFFGTATVGERGQVVIPAEARKKLGIHPGDKVLVLGHPIGAGIMFCKIDAVREMSTMFSFLIENIEKAGSEDA